MTSWTLPPRTRAAAASAAVAAMGSGALGASLPTNAEDIAQVDRQRAANGIPAG